MKGYWRHKDRKYWTMDETRKDIKKMKKLKNTYKNRKKEVERNYERQKKF